MNLIVKHATVLGASGEAAADIGVADGAIVLSGSCRQPGQAGRHHPIDVTESGGI